MPQIIRILFLLVGYFAMLSGFSSLLPSQLTVHTQHLNSALMSDKERSRSTKNGVSTIVKEMKETDVDEKKDKEVMWHVVLHKDKLHTSNYVIRILCNVVGTLDRKTACMICFQKHIIRKATVTKTWKKQGEKFCLDFQCQGLTVSISLDEDVNEGHSGGGL
jgi:ATP-dependent Clp protease adapter protein ClpS